MAIFVCDTGGLFFLGLADLFLAGLLPLLGLLPPRGDLFRGLGLLLPLLGGGEPPLRRGPGDPFLGAGDFFLSGDFFFSGVAGALLLPLEDEEDEEDEEEELSELLALFLGRGAMILYR